MQSSTRNILGELHHVVELIWWSLIKVPSVAIVVWAFIHLLSHPSETAVQTLEVAQTGLIDPALVVRIVSLWLICGAAALGFSILSRYVFRIEALGADDKPRFDHLRA
ncbi:MAG: hypothetical protein Q9M30_10825 [Mariprofundaceae bacterium]|nr:hypothetical protein [Mariprofundaceae bacterium]